MVETKPFVLEAQVIVNIPSDILQNKRRVDAVKRGIKKAMTKGLYEQGVDFEIKKLTLKAG